MFDTVLDITEFVHHHSPPNLLSGTSVTMHYFLLTNVTARMGKRHLFNELLRTKVITTETYKLIRKQVT